MGQYLKCGFELAQWDTIGDYAKLTDNHALQMDVLWRLGEWATLKQKVLPVAQVRAVCGAPHSKPFC